MRIAGVLLGALLLGACGGEEPAGQNDPAPVEEPPAAAPRAGLPLDPGPAAPIAVPETPPALAPEPPPAAPAAVPEPAAAAPPPPQPAPATPVAADPAPAATPPPAAPAAQPAAAAPAPTPVPGLSPALLTRLAAADQTAGQIAAGRCLVCHSVGAGETAVVGPNLFEIVGALVGRAPGFDYSPALRALNAQGATWSFDLLDAFLRDPAAAIPGNRMEFPGLADDAIRANVILYLHSLSAAPVPLTVTAAREVPVVPFDPTALFFTAAQVEAGADAYARHGCMPCHGANLMGDIDMREGGMGNPSPLVGANFVNRWAERSIADLFERLRSEKPIDAPGTLPDETYAALVAFILSNNGFTAGDVPLPNDVDALRILEFHQ